MTVFRLIGAIVIDIDLEQVAHRVLEDAIQEAIPGYWRRRAEQFEAARSKPGDFIGRTEGDPTDRDRRCAETAAACRQHAILLEQDGLPADTAEDEIRQLLDELLEGRAA